MNITHDTNFCRVFEMPESYPAGFCFSGARPVEVQMVDWFKPIFVDDIDSGEFKTWSEYSSFLIDFMKPKSYVKPGRQYVLVTDFGESLSFIGE